MDAPARSVRADPQTLARISRLELRARAVVEGVISGLHQSPHRGSSVEFAQHRDYVPGDEIRHIDWKVYARSDRYHIKQFEEETNLKATILLDASSSMEYRGTNAALSKRDYAAITAAALSTLLMQQRDAVGLATFDSAVRQYIPPSSTSAHLRLLLETLERAGSRPSTGLGATLHDIAERVRRRGLIILLSDLLAPPQEILHGLQHFRHRKHEVIVFHVLDRDELSFPFKETALFEGMEREEPLTAEPNALRREYLRALTQHITALKGGCRELGMDYQQLVTDESPEIALSRYLAQRMRRD
ncbi:MAG TPA: DUF58 domain-containing protein [Chthonomonadales bacterium]|nr:DUF58 domain-containing protein [Chthonomonadales bacterium]